MLECAIRKIIDDWSGCEHCRLHSKSACAVPGETEISVAETLEPGCQPFLSKLVQTDCGTATEYAPTGFKMRPGYATGQYRHQRHTGQ